MPQHDRITTADDVQIEYLLDGTHNDETIVFIPGLGAHLAQFRDQVAEFSEHYRTLAISLRGHGESTYPPDPGPDDFGFDVLAADVAQVLDRLEIPWAHVVGNSTGGVVAYQLLAQAPQLVRSVTTFGTAAELHTGALGHVVVFLDRLLGPQGDAWLAERTVSEHEDVASLVGDMIRSTPKDVIVNLRRNLIDYSFIPTLRDYPEVPVLLIKGEHDNDINRVLSSTLAELAQRERTAVVELAGAGHFANLDEPAAFNDALTRFLERI